MRRLSALQEENAERKKKGNKPGHAKTKSWAALRAEQNRQIRIINAAGKVEVSDVINDKSKCFSLNRKPPTQRKVAG